MNKLSKLSVIIVGVVVAAGCVGAAEHQHKDHKGHGSKKTVHQTQCPIIQKNKIDKSLYYEHDGKKIYVCCEGCIKKVAENPAKYVKQLESAGITLDKAQTTCPVMGGKIKNKKLFADHDGKRVYFCCEMCPEKFKKDPEKYIKKLQDAGVALDHTPKKEHAEKKEGHGGHH